ncbi:hypothetical protein HHK36_027205 [Tetracentron sinense]|uniref:Uncharacterized protein n=1 Tax=Tetracentron sinense TaxID=13715 RepID=A0A834YKZ6_TETSI|nr:hypothetical protein HHK36_027205 [Tetracentron sinense]
MNCFLVFLFITISIPSSSLASESSTIYDVLRSHGLPMGLLPKGVREFSLDEHGRFDVHLEEDCNAKFENEVHYDRNISGTLSYGQIGALSGISARELFLWFPVKGIRVDIPSSGIIYFDVGVIYKRFSLSLFETPPDCLAVKRVGSTDLLLQEGKIIAETVSKSQSGNLRYKVGQEDMPRTIWLLDRVSVYAGVCLYVRLSVLSRLKIEVARLCMKLWTEHIILQIISYSHPLFQGSLQVGGKTARESIQANFRDFVLQADFGEMTVLKSSFM